MIRRLVFALALGSALLVAPGTSFAQEGQPTFVTQMSGFEEVPGTATLAKGFTGLQFSADGNTVYYTITVTDASTPLMAAHLHFGASGENGPVVVPLCAAPAKPCQTEGVVTQGTFSAADFSGPWASDGLDRLINESRNGMVYANVHSTKFPGGEARGQMVDLAGTMQPGGPSMEPSMSDGDGEMHMDH